MSDDNYAEVKVRAWLYYLKDLGYANIPEEAFAYSSGGGEFSDTYTVIASEGVESVRIGMRIKLNRMLQGEGNIWNSIFGVGAYLNEKIPIYEAYAGLNEDGLYDIYSSSGNLDIEDFTPITNGYKLSDFTDIVYFSVEPGEFWIDYYLFTGVLI